MIKHFNKISEIANKYEGFIVDLWGVIHDGREAYSGVHECLELLKEHNKRVIFLSNAPRRAWRAVDVLKRLGIKDEWYQNIITSGEVAFEYIKNNGHNFASNKYMIIGPAMDDGLLDGLDYERVYQASDASFAIVTGFDNDDSTLEEKIPDILSIKQYDLPLICVNPDKCIVRKTGVKALCAGIMAEYYESIGGKAIYFGKPHKNVYDVCLTKLSGKIAAIGDSLETDIKGANNLGIDSYLIAGGVHGGDFGVKYGELPKDTETLSLFCNKMNVIPTGILSAFNW